MLRLARRLADAVAIVAGGLVMLHYVGVDPTARSPASASAASPWRWPPEDARERHRRALHHLRQGGARGRLPQVRRNHRDGRLHRTAIDAHPNAGSDHAQRAQRTDSQREHRTLSARDKSGFITSSGCITRRPPTRCASSSTAFAPVSPSTRSSIAASRSACDASASAGFRWISRCSRTSSSGDWERFLELAAGTAARSHGRRRAEHGATIALSSQTLYRANRRGDAPDVRQRRDRAGRGRCRET